MSQHRFPAHTSTGRAVEVLVGYDRPLHGFFLVVTATAEPTSAAADLATMDGKECDEDAEDGDVFVYSNLDDVDLIDLGGQTLDLDYFKGKLSRLGIALPTPIEHGLQEDRLNRVGNRVRWYDAAGALLPVSEG
jgi:hypothetical protein